MADYDKWMDAMIKAHTSIGLGLRDAFEAGQRNGLEKAKRLVVLNTHRSGRYVGFCTSRPLKIAIDQLAKEAAGE